MHRLFSGKKYHIRDGQDITRHPQDPNTLLEYKKHGSSNKYFLYKQLAHHFELWGELGQHHVSVQLRRRGYQILTQDF